VVTTIGGRTLEANLPFHRTAYMRAVIAGNCNSDHSSMYMALGTDVGIRHVDPHRHLDTRLWSLGELKEAVLAVVHRLARWRLHQVWGNLQTDSLAQSTRHQDKWLIKGTVLVHQCQCKSFCICTAMQDSVSLGNLRNCDDVSSKFHQGERQMYRVTVQKRHR